MTKTYHFMAGLPRSGSNVLSAILNQNPSLYSSPQTDLVAMLYNLESAIPQYESYKAGLLHQGYASVMHKMTDTFYSHIDKPVIIEKNRGWGTPYNWDNLKGYVNPNGKVILTMRPILEVLASFVKIAKASQKITGYLQYVSPELWVTSYREQADAMVDSLMQTNGEIERSIFSIHNLLVNHRESVYVVWFDDLIEHPAATLKAIDNFLELESFDYNFNAISPADKHNDLAGYGVANLHAVKKQLVRPKTDPADYLSDYIISKYKNALDFLQF